MDTTLVPLNLIWDYPIRWTRFEVLRDLIQNFYDSVGPERWHSAFEHWTNGDELVFRTRDVEFSWEWLVPIGASTKRDSAGTYSGYFGEGFKMAALCARRDHGWELEMESRDWAVRVTKTETSIDGRHITSLALETQVGRPRSRDTVLRLRPFRASDQEILRGAMLSFYYEDNPLLAEPIFAGPSSAIFRRSSQAKPLGYPESFEFGGPGIVFAAFQALGSMPVPLVVCMHPYRPTDRERRTLYRMDVLSLFKRVVEGVPPQAAATVLELMKRQWYDYPSKKYDFCTWYPVVNALTASLARSEEATEGWRKRYPRLLVAKPVKRQDLTRVNRRREALAWLRTHAQPHRLVQDGFLRLGYPTLEDVCEKAGGFSSIRPPTPSEARLVEILEQAASEVFGGILAFESLPPCQILEGAWTPWKGMATCVPLRDRADGHGGARIRHHLPLVGLQAGLFQPDKFDEALATYLHELAHRYGGDSSAAFSQILSALLEQSIARATAVQVYRAHWDAACASSEPESV